MLQKHSLDRSLSLFLGREVTLGVISPWTGHQSVAGNLRSTRAGTHHSWEDWSNEKPNALLKATLQRGKELTISVWIPVLKIKPQNIQGLQEFCGSKSDFSCQIRPRIWTGFSNSAAPYLLMFILESLCAQFSLWLIVCVSSISWMRVIIKHFFVNNALLA